MPKQRKKTVTGRVLHDPVKDKLRPMFPLDLSKCSTVDELVRGMGNTAFTGRQIGDAAEIVEMMARDKDCFVVMTLSGALTVAKMGLVFCDLIESGVVNAIVSTGALMAHGLVEATGLSHFRYNPAMDDKELFEAGYNRVYDSLEPETNLDHVEDVMDEILNNWDAEEVVCSWKLHAPFCVSTRSKTLKNSRIRCWRRSAWGFLRSAAEYRATGRNSLESMRSCWRGVDIASCR